MSIKLLCFDFDGTCVDTRETHFLALNYALAKNNFPVIPEKDFNKWDGLSTKQKLEALASDGKVDRNSFACIEKDKQEKTIELYNRFKRDDKVYSTLSTFFNMGYSIALVTNGIPETVHLLLKKMEIEQFFGAIITNADGRPKPAPDLYVKALKTFRHKAEETLVIEDGERGIAAARAAGIKNIVKVNGPHDLSTRFVLTKIYEANNCR